MSEFHDDHSFYCDEEIQEWLKDKDERLHPSTMSSWTLLLPLKILSLNLKIHPGQFVTTNTRVGQKKNTSA